MGGKIKKSNLHDDVSTMISTMIEEQSLDSDNFDAQLASKSTDDLSEGTNLYYTTARANTDFDTKLAAADTDDLSEGSTNLYYTDARADARADARIAAATTDDLSEGGSNLYYTSTRANTDFDAKLAAADTDDLSEGASNQYFTQARARGSVSLGTAGSQAYNSSTGVFTIPGTTDHITEGSNQFYTDARADARIAAATTDDLSEGSTNLYYTDARVGTYISGNRSYGNITTTGYLAGPATFTIDPSAVGDNTGTVVIAGNLQVDGTTTTINSTTVTVDDLNITLASGAANAAAANGAGITVDTANATITYDATNDEWDFNKAINVAGSITVSGTVDGRDISGITASNAELNIMDGVTATTAELNIMDGVTATTTELNYMDGVSSNVQTQLNAKLDKSGGEMTGNITFSGSQTVDGRDLSADGAKLDGIESGATADQTITAGSGLSGGGTGDVTLSHADTSSQGNVNNSNGTVIQDITLDTYGHITGLGSVNLDSRYYTESEADSRFANVAGDTFTGAISGTTISLSGGITASPAATLIVYNSAGTAVKTINGITAA